MLHLNAHSVYSYKKSILKIEDLIQWEKDHGQNSFCITDLDSMTSYVKANGAAEKHGMKFIHGMDILVKPEAGINRQAVVDRINSLNKSLTTKRVERDPLLQQQIKEEIAEIESKDAVYYHRLTLLAANEVGLKNMMKMYRDGRVDGPFWTLEIENILSLADGVVCLFGFDSHIGHAVRNGQISLAQEQLDNMYQAFDNRLYLSLSAQYEDKGMSMMEHDFYQKALEMIKPYGVLPVATNDCRYVSEEEWLDYRLYCNIFNETSEILQFPTNWHELCTEEQLRKRMIDRYGDFLNDEILDQAFQSVKDIDNMISQVMFPHADPLKDCHEELRELVERGWQKKRVGTEKEQESRDRLEMELSVINMKGFSQYFLKVLNIIKVAQELGILVGPARGSGGGSEVCYLVGITKVDPLEYGLYFERFLNPGRPGFPDIDLDFASQPLSH